MPEANPIVFVSYTHESPSHKAWVASLATDLRRRGIDVILDQWDLKLGDDLTLFMERGIRSSARVLLICTPTYKRKADEGQGGVGYERLVVTGEIAANIETNKFVCALRDGDKPTSIPTFGATRLFVDFRNDSVYEVSLEELARDIHQAPAASKPPLGLNPFVHSAPAPVAAVPTAEELKVLSPDDAYHLAESALHQPNLISWKRLLRALRSQIGPRLGSWRQNVESIATDDFDKWLETLGGAIDAVAPLFVCALVAIESNQPQVSNQISFIDDLMSVPAWNGSGRTVVVETPSALAFVYHFAIGAYLMSENRLQEAIALLRTTIVDRFDRDSSPLYRSHAIMGWPKSLGGDSNTAWDYLISLFGRQTWLNRFFGSERDFQLSLRAYALIASMLEFTDEIKAKALESNIESARRLHVPPMFLLTVNSELSFTQVLRKALPSSESVAHLAELTGVSADDLRSRWSKWVQLWTAWHGASGRHLFMFRDEIPKLP